MTSRKYVSGRTSAIACRKVGNSAVGPNEPERNAIGRITTFTAAETPSSERMSAAAAKPRAAKQATPMTIAPAKPSQFAGMLAPNASPPSTSSAAVSIAKVTSVERRTAAR